MTADVVGIEHFIPADRDVAERAVISLEGDVINEVAECAIFDQ